MVSVKCSPGTSLTLPKPYRGSARGRNQYLVLIKGLEDAGPFVLTLKGVGGDGL